MWFKFYPEIMPKVIKFTVYKASFFNIVLEVLTIAIGQEKDIKAIEIRKE